MYGYFTRSIKYMHSSNACSECSEEFFIIHHFYLSLFTKQNIMSHIIVLEESYQEFFIIYLYQLSNKTIYNEYITLQVCFARFLLKIGLYHYSHKINQQRNA